MNYYDELGVARGASNEEIRKAHHTLCKLLHPDQQRDAALRAAAEIQMRRINGITAILLNRERRRQYDQSLSRAEAEQMPAMPPLRNPAGILAEKWGAARPWAIIIATAALSAFAGAWFSSGDAFLIESTRDGAATPPPQNWAARKRETPRSNAPDATPAPDPPRRYFRSRGKPAVVARPQPVPLQARHAPLSPEAAGMASAPLGSVPPPPVRAAPDETERVRPAAVQRDADTGLSGLWVYARSSGAADQQMPLYAPEYVQLQIRCNNQDLEGTYISRYMVPDRAVSPTVAFTFRGVMGSSDDFHWRASDGSRGVVAIKLLTRNSIQVNWRVAQFGSEIGLGAGTAVLIRKAQETH